LAPQIFGLATPLLPLMQQSDRFTANP